MWIFFFIVLFFLDTELIKPLATHYSLTMDDLSMEIKQARRMLERNSLSYEGPLHFAEYLKPQKKLHFWKLCRAVQIKLTIPASTAGCERTFSKLKLIKTAWRSIMLDSRLKSLTILSVHRRTLDLDLDDVVERLTARYPNMRIAIS